MEKIIMIIALLFIATSSLARGARPMNILKVLASCRAVRVHSERSF
jgi:hypothetical protein